MHVNETDNLVRICYVSPSHIFENLSHMTCVSIKEETTASIQIAFLELELDDLEGCFQPKSFCDSLILGLHRSILNHLIFFISFIPFCFTWIKKVCCHKKLTNSSFKIQERDQLLPSMPCTVSRN